MARVRRTPEQARRLILDTAAQRLAQRGLKGLHVQDVARDAGISHATLLHHFGSADGMQRALMGDMTTRLVEEVVAALEDQAVDDEVAVVRALFETLAKGGHAKLIAWAAITEQNVNLDPAARGTTARLFTELLDILVRRMGGQRERAQRVVYLVATSALGAAMAGQQLPGLLGMSVAETEAFPAWLAKQVSA